MAFPLKSVNLKSAWGGGGPFPDSAPKFCKSCNSSGDMVLRPSTNNKEICSYSQLFFNSRRGRFQDFADFKISQISRFQLQTGQISRFRRFQDFCMWLSVFPFWCKRSKMAVTSSEEWNLDSGNLLFCTIFRRIARFQDFCTVILHRLIFPFWCNCQQKSRFPEKQISNHELVAVNVFPFWCKLSKVFSKFTPIQRSKADLAWAETQISDFENPELQKGPLSAKKTEFRIADFRFPAWRLHKQGGVQIHRFQISLRQKCKRARSLHQFLRFRSFCSN